MLLFTNFEVCRVLKIPSLPWHLPPLPPSNQIAGTPDFYMMISTRHTGFTMQYIVERAELHELTNDDQIRRLVTGTHDRQYVWMIKYSTSKKNKGKRLNGQRIAPIK